MLGLHNTRDKLDVRLIASDLDGTLLNEKKEIRQRNLQAICKAADKTARISSLV